MDRVVLELLQRALQINESLVDHIIRIEARQNAINRRNNPRVMVQRIPAEAPGARYNANSQERE